MLWGEMSQTDVHTSNAIGCLSRSDRGPKQCRRIPPQFDDTKWAYVGSYSCAGFTHLSSSAALVQRVGRSNHFLHIGAGREGMWCRYPFQSPKQPPRCICWWRCGEGNFVNQQGGIMVSECLYFMMDCQWKIQILLNREACARAAFLSFWFHPVASSL